MNSAARPFDILQGRGKPGERRAHFRSQRPRVFGVIEMRRPVKKRRLSRQVLKRIGAFLNKATTRVKGGPCVRSEGAMPSARRKGWTHSARRVSSALNIVMIQPFEFIRVVLRRGLAEMFQVEPCHKLLARENFGIAM